MTVPALKFPIRCNQQLLFMGVVALSFLKALLSKNSITLELMKSNPINSPALPALSA
jgi:hypothetical protein